MQPRDQSKGEIEQLAQRRIVKNAGLLQKCEKASLGMLAKDRRREGTLKVMADHGASLLRGRQQESANFDLQGQPSNHDLRG